MKKFAKVGCGCCTVLLVLIIAAVVGLNVVLKDHLAQMINEHVIPPAEKALGVNVDMASASINLVGGSVSFGGIKLGNPEGFSEPSLFALEEMGIDIGMGGLIKLATGKEGGVIEISKVAFKGAEITIIRNAAEGTNAAPINVKVLIDSLSAGTEEAPEAEAGDKKDLKIPEIKPGDKKDKKDKKDAEHPDKEHPKGEHPEHPAAKPAGPTELPPAVLKALDISTVLSYIDHDEKRPMNMAIKSSINISDISTAAAELEGAGLINIIGALASDANLCVTDIKGTIQPIGDPMKMTFDITGDIAHVDLSQLMGRLEDMGLGGCESLSLNLKLKCDDGVFDGDLSRISMILKEVVWRSNETKNFPDGELRIPVLTVPVPVKGTLAEPKAKFGEGLIRALVETAKGSAGDIAKQAAAKEAKKHLKKAGLGNIDVGGLFGGKKKADADDGAEKKTDSKKDAGDELKKKAPTKKLGGGLLKKKKLF